MDNCYWYCLERNSLCLVSCWILSFLAFIFLVNLKENKIQGYTMRFASVLRIEMCMYLRRKCICSHDTQLPFFFLCFPRGMIDLIENPESLLTLICSKIFLFIGVVFSLVFCSRISRVKPQNWFLFIWFSFQLQSRRTIKWRSVFVLWPPNWSFFVSTIWSYFK